MSIVFRFANDALPGYGNSTPYELIRVNILNKQFYVNRIIHLYRVRQFNVVILLNQPWTMRPRLSIPEKYKNYGRIINDYSIYDLQQSSITNCLSEACCCCCSCLCIERVYWTTLCNSRIAKYMTVCKTWFVRLH